MIEATPKALRTYNEEIRSLNEENRRTIEENRRKSKRDKCIKMFCAKHHRLINKEIRAFCDGYFWLLRTLFL